MELKGDGSEHEKARIGVHCNFKDHVEEGDASRPASHHRAAHGQGIGRTCDKKIRYRAWTTRTLRAPDRLRTSEAELFFLRHLRSAAACASGACCSSSAASARSQCGLLVKLELSLDCERSWKWIWGIALESIRTLAASVNQMLRISAFMQNKLFVPQGATPLILLAISVLPGASGKVLFTAFHVLLATLDEMHMGQPLCSLLSAAAAWDLLEGHVWPVRVGACSYMWLVSPAFPLNAGTPLRSERVADLVLAARCGDERRECRRAGLGIRTRCCIFPTSPT